MQLYPDFQVCFIHDGFQYSVTKAVIAKGEWKLYLLEVPAEGKYFFTAHQKSKRLYPAHMRHGFK